MQILKIYFYAIRVFLSLGLTCGYGEVVWKMARSVYKAQTEDPFSASQFNQQLWSGGTRSYWQTKPVSNPTKVEFTKRGANRLKAGHERGPTGPTSTHNQPGHKYQNTNRS